MKRWVYNGMMVWTVSRGRAEWGLNMSKAVLEILERIEQLPEEDRLILEQRLAELRRG